MSQSLFRRLVPVASFLAFTLHLAGPAPLAAGPEPDPQAKALAALHQASQRPAEVRFDAGLPVFVDAEVPVPAGFPVDPVLRALDFLTRYSDLFRLADPRAELVLVRITGDEAGGQHVVFGQVAAQTVGQHVPVFGAQLAVHLHGDAVTGANGRWLADLPVLATPVLSADQARAIALQKVPATEPTVIGEPRLAVHDPALLDTGAEPNPRLAWHLVVAGEDVHTGVGSSWLVLLDAADGQPLLVLDQTMRDLPRKDFEVYTADHGTSRDCWGGPGPGGPGLALWYRTAGLVPGVAPSADGPAAWSGLHLTYNLFFDSVHRHSWDGRDGRIEALVHVGREPYAAYLVPCNNLVFSDGYATLDVLAHEYTHGVNRWSAGLDVMGEPGALNESFADVFGVLVDYGDWTLGEDLPARAEPYCPAPYPAGTARDLANPSACSVPRYCPTPDHMSRLCTLPPGIAPSCARLADGGNDCGFIHINSGIPNKAAHLMMAGGTHEGVTVRGMGRAKTGRLLYDVLTTRLTATSRFRDARDAAVALARAYARLRLYDFTTQDACATINAYAAVGLGAPDTDCDLVEDDTDADLDGDGVDNPGDNCPAAHNPGQQNADRDGEGDACDSDDDNDGRPDAADNCRTVPNPGQEDADRDRIGDACEDRDGDGVPDPVDTCPTTPNPSQDDLDGDGRGDECDADADGDGIGIDPIAGLFDNCPLVRNPDQGDGDGDQVGDACDACPALPDDQTDTDGDGRGDACDPDSDNDGILDDGDGSGTAGDNPCVSGRTILCDDNCRLDRNRDQSDLDANGVGSVCDGAEQRLFFDPGDLEAVIRAIDGVPVIRIPIPVCLSCPYWLPESFRVRVQLGLGSALPARIIDDRGNVLAKGAGEQQDLVFFPSPEAHYLPPVQPPYAPKAKAEPYRGREYFLEINLEQVAPGKEVPVSLGVTSGVAGGQ